MRHFRIPFRPHVFKRGRIHQTEAQQEAVSLRITKRSQSIVVFLAGCVPQSQVDRSAVDHYVSRVVVKNSRNIFARKSVCRVANEQARLTHSAIAHNHTFNGLHGAWKKWTAERLTTEQLTALKNIAYSMIPTTLLSNHSMVVIF